MSVVVLCLVRAVFRVERWRGDWLRRGCPAGLVVIGVGTCQPVGAAGRPFAPDYANCADACASPSILHAGLSLPHSQLGR